MSQRSDEYLVWMDMEMTGLDPERETILEIATLITTNGLDLVAEGPVLVIQQPRAILEAMDEWNREHHGASGLAERALASDVSMADAEGQTLAFVKRYCPERVSPLCGNSIYQDRRFLARYMPALEAYLHYRNIDVSTVKELVRRWYPGGAAGAGEEARPPGARRHPRVDRRAALLPGPLLPRAAGLTTFRTIPF